MIVNKLLTLIKPSVIGFPNAFLTPTVMQKENNSLMSIRKWSKTELCIFSNTDSLFPQNWIAYESLQNAAKLKANQQIVDFPNDESPKEEYHNAFCQVRDRSLCTFTKTRISLSKEISRN